MDMKQEDPAKLGAKDVLSHFIFFVKEMASRHGGCVSLSEATVATSLKSSQ